VTGAQTCALPIPRRVVLWARRAPAPWHPKCDGASDHRSDALVMHAVELVLPALQLLQPTEGEGGDLVARQAVVFLADCPELRPREAFLPWAFVGSACPGGTSGDVARMAARILSRTCSMSRSVNIFSTSSIVSSGWCSRRPDQRSCMHRSVSARSASVRTSRRIENPETRWNSTHACMP